MNVETLRDQFLYDLRGQYYVETTLADALDRLVDQTAVDSLDEAPDAELRDALASAFADHRDETDEHVDRLERAFEALDRQPDARPSPPIDGIVEEKERFTNVVLNDAARPLHYLDTGLKTERLEVRTYESLLANAERLDAPDDAIAALEANLDDEREALQRLEELADGSATESLRDRLADRSPEL